ncbi:glycosyltransferase family 4 protein (plasmid) [Halorussus salilacus]|uniref:glycosyltransferase family 4 protein n=1 Tax=Halorussus salilacus TaxID=2953750 RepID=UPI0020A09E71|nr:glycosyltransferase family 4 protein [Halorussus salilacus]USZ69778.1 glycosyltransferase family 4 protein [Halorussus salilacus]
MNVLNLVSNADAQFYEEQTRVLERRGVSCDTVTPPGNHLAREEVQDRTPTDYLRFVPRVIRESFDDYDLVHANYGLTAPMALAQIRHPVVLSLWGSDLMGEYGWLSKACAPYCDAVIVMSDEMARELGEPCHVIPHGIDTEKFAPRPTEEARAEVGWSDETRHVLFPYPPSDEVKDLPRAERVVERANRRIDAPVELQVVYGVPHEKVATYMNAADALLLTSEREGSPNSVKEAMSCNLPVVATDVGDVRERLDGVSPSRVGESDDELVDGLVDVLEAPRRSDGREAVDEVSLDRMGERIRAVYASVV